MKVRLKDLAINTAETLSSNNLKSLAGIIFWELKDRNKLAKLDLFIEQVEVEKARISGKKMAYIETPFNLNAEEVNQIRQKLEEKTNVKLELIVRTNKTLIGGFKAKIDDEVLDFSYKGKLNQIKEKLAG